jgi:hypothetical protein
MRSLRVASIAILAVCPLAVPLDASAQEGRRVVVRLTVTDTNGNGIAGARIAISRDSVGAILVGETDAAGRFVARLALGAARHVASARRIGFRQAEAELPGSRDTVDLSLRLKKLANSELERVNVTARQSQYVLDAAQIAASRRPVRDAFEALLKLRPSMLHDGDRCPHDVVDNVWINGRRELFMASRVPILGASRSVGAVRFSMHTARRQSREPPALDSLLASIRAEHVESITLLNCWDTSFPGVGTNNALYVVLKPGTGWDSKRGSFRADSIRRN